MKYVIDTSSLISLSRYFLFFDSEEILINLLEKKFKSEEIILLDKVQLECERFAKGLVMDKMSFLQEKELWTPTSELLPNKKFFNQLENQFINGFNKQRLNATQFETLKKDFLEGADCKLILYCQQQSDCKIVTEETKQNNDGKGFKKIPAICEILKLPVITLPEMLMEFSDELKIEFQG